MSTTSQERTRSCAECQDDFTVTESPRPNHCSHNCYYLDKGNAVINQLDSDHKICSSCYKRIKSISPPGEQWKEDKSDRVQVALDHGGEMHAVNGELVLDARGCPTKRTVAVDSVIGFQYQTENTDWGTDKKDTENGYQQIPYQRWICDCGNVDISERNEELQTVDLHTTIRSLLLRLQELTNEGAIGGNFDHERFLERFEASELNFKESIGYCQYGP